MAKWEVTNSDGYLIHTHPTNIICMLIYGGVYLEKAAFI